MILTEDIEMDLLSSEELRVAKRTPEEEGTLEQRRRRHPLVPDEEGGEEPGPPARTPTGPNGSGARTEPRADEELKPCSPDPVKTREPEIEMQMFPSLGAADRKWAQASKKTTPAKWKRVSRDAGLVVKDVVCLPSGYLAQQDRRSVPDLRQMASPTVSARVTIDSGWSAAQMHNCLVMFLGRWFLRPAGQKLSFTVLQCVQGSSVLFVPETPAEGWTGRRVLRICEHGPLYVLSHLDHTQAEPDQSVKNSIAARRPEVRQKPGEEVTLHSLLRLYRQQNADSDGQVHVCVKRGDVLGAALEVMARPDFSFRNTPIVSSDGKEADRRQTIWEFFRSVLVGLQDSSLFEGLPGRLLLTYDLTALERRMYHKAGVLIGWSLAHGGPGPRCLHPALFQLMCSQNPSLEDFSERDIVGAEVQSRLQQLRGCTDASSVPPSLSDWVLSCGISGICSEEPDQVPDVYASVVKHYIYHRVASMVFQFKEGLNSCGGLWDTIQSHWETFVPVMTGARRLPLTRLGFQQLFTVCYSQSEGSLRAAEEATVGRWEAALEEVGEGRADFSLEELLTFITGAERLPPLGLPTLISLRFYSQDDEEPCERLPYASSCPLELFLPRAALAAVDLLVLLSRAVHESQG